MPFWDDPRIEPKRTYRFLVPFRVYLPRDASPGRPVTISEWARCGADLLDVNTSKYGINNVFWFMAQSVTKPGVRTSLARTENLTSGYALQRRNQPLEWSFEPVSLQLIDTYDHDIEMSITALLFALGGIQQPEWGELNMGSKQFGGSMVPIDNGVTDEFSIIELLESGYSGGNPSSLASLSSPIDEGLRQEMGIRSLRNSPRASIPSSWARKIVLKNPYLVNADFGSLDYSSNAFSSVSLQISYDSYDLIHLTDRHNFDPSITAARSMQELRRNQQQVRGNLRGQGQMSSVRDAHRRQRQEFRSEMRSGDVEVGRKLE